MGRTLRSVHDEEALRFEAAAREQRLDFFSKRRLRHRREFVEQRRDEHRIDHDHRHHHRHEAGPADEPPIARDGALDRKKRKKQRNGQTELQRDRLDLIENENARRRAVETEGRFEPEGAIKRQRQIEEIADGADEEHDGDAARQARRNQPRDQGIGGREKDREPKDGDDRIEALFHHAQPRARQSIVGGAAMVFEGELARESGRHLILMRGDGENLPALQIEFQNPGKKDGGDDEKGDGSHETCLRCSRNLRVIWGRPKNWRGKWRGEVARQPRPGGSALCMCRKAMRQGLAS